MQVLQYTVYMANSNVALIFVDVENDVRLKEFGSQSSKRGQSIKPIYYNFTYQIACMAHFAKSFLH